MIRNRSILLADVLLTVFTAYAAFALRVDFQAFLESYRSIYPPYALACVIVKPLVFYCFGLYRRFWVYAGVRELLAIVYAVTVAAMVLTVIVVLMIGTDIIGAFPRSVLFIDWLLTLMSAGGIRMGVRVWSEIRLAPAAAATQKDKRRVLVAGAGQAGAMAVREMQRNPQLGLAPVAFIDDDRAKHRSIIHGVPVRGPRSALADLVRLERIDEIIVAMPKAPGDVVRDIAERAHGAGVPFRTLPGIFELLDGQVSVSRLRTVEIGDLLRREQIRASSDGAAYVRGCRVLVTGAGGSIGSEITRQVAHARPESLVLLGRGEHGIFEAHNQLRERFPGVPVVPVIADVRDEARLERVFRTHAPDIVFHAAAHKHVPLMEDHPEEAVMNNIQGTANVVAVSLACHIRRLVMISTDKAVQPSSIMGASKRIAEAVVRDAAVRHGRAFAVVRFGNVLGSRGSAVPTFKAQIEQGGPVTITHPDMRRFFMTIGEAVHLVLEAGGMVERGELFVLNMGEPIRIVDLVHDLMRLAGVSADQIRIEFTGLRPGERLEEYLWDAGADIRSTANPNVMRVVEEDWLPSGGVEPAVRALREAACRGDAATIRALFAHYLPAYAPSAASTARLVV